VRFTKPLVPARLIRRYKRFLADVEIAGQAPVTAHCPNPGSMMGLAAPGADIAAALAGSPESYGAVRGTSFAAPLVAGLLARELRQPDVTAAQQALTALTAQDFGASERKWRKWYDTARRRHRVEWLIEGLGHKEDAIRETAINALRRLTGEYFGYHHDLPKKEREASAERWSAWWRETGQRRFILKDDERQR